MKERKEACRAQIFNLGPYSLAKLTDICKEMFKKWQKEWNGATPIIEYELFIDVSYDYYESITEFWMIFYRMESDEEVKKREASLERKRLANQQQAQTIKVKRAELEKDPEYIKYKELQKKFKGK